MPSGHLPGKVFQPRASGRGSQGRLRTRWGDHICGLAREHLRTALEELLDVAGERHVRASSLKLLPHDPDLDKETDGPL